MRYGFLQQSGSEILGNLLSGEKHMYGGGEGSELSGDFRLLTEKPNGEQYVKLL